MTSLRFSVREAGITSLADCFSYLLLKSHFVSTKCSQFTVMQLVFWVISLIYISCFNIQFWGNLSCSVRRDLLRIDKQSLFEHVRKNMYCSRCNGLLLEAFSQLVDYSKGGRGDSLWHHNKRIRGSMKGSCNTGDAKATSDTEDDIRDPSVHPWGGLTVTRDNTLTLIDCLLEGKSMEVIQNVRKGFS